MKIAKIFILLFLLVSSLQAQPLTNRQRIENLVNLNRDQEQQIIELQIEIARIEAILFEEGTVDINDPSQAPSGEVFLRIEEYRVECESLREEHVILITRVEILTQEIDRLDRIIDEKEQTIFEQSQMISELEAEIRYLEDEIARISAELDSMTAIVRCTEEAYQRRYERSLVVEDSLRLARLKFDTLRQGINGNMRSDRQNILAREIYDIYENFQGDTLTKVCGNTTHELEMDFFRVSDHVIMAKILELNLADRIDVLGDNPDAKSRQLTARILKNVSEALKKSNGNYNIAVADVRIADLIQNLPASILPPALRNDDQNSDIIRELEQIRTMFDKSDYVESLSIYNTYERLVEIEEVLENDELINNIRYCIGTILMYDLDQVSEAKELATPGSWFKRIGNKSQSTGFEMLSNVLENSNPEDEIYQNASMMISRYHSKEVKTSNSE